MVTSTRHSKTKWLERNMGMDIRKQRDNGVILQKLLQGSATW